MITQTVIHHTFVLERSYPVQPELVFAAFADPITKRRWFVEGDHHQVEHFDMEFRVGGRESAGMRFSEGTHMAGVLFTNETTYLDIVANQRIVFAASMSLGDKCISASLGTVELLPSATRTDLIFTHQAAFFEGSDGPEMREAGWGKLFEKLAAELAR